MTTPANDPPSSPAESEAEAGPEGDAPPPDNSPPTAVPLDTSPADPLAEIVDDLAPKEDAAEWVHEQMLKGGDSESLIADLVEQGWSQDDAEEIVEFVRKETRHERGVVTRDDVARKAYVSYRRSTRRLPWFAFGGLVGIVVAMSNLLSSLAGLRQLKIVRKPQQREGAKDEGKG